jgi:hypothetical protein
MPSFIENFVGGFFCVFCARAYWAASTAGAAAAAARNLLLFIKISG